MTNINSNYLTKLSFFKIFEKFQKTDEPRPEETSPPTVSQGDNNGKIIPSGDVLSALEGDNNLSPANTEPMTIDPLTREIITTDEFKAKYGDGSQKIYVKIPNMMTEYTKMTVEEYRRKYTNVDNPPEAFVEKPVIKVHTYSNKLQKLGFNEKEIEKYFDKHEDDFWGTTYTLKDDITVEVQSPIGYINDDKIDYDIVKIDTVEKLMEYMGINSRNNLKEKGLTDEVIDKYFRLMVFGGNGKATYGLKFGYSNYTVDETISGLKIIINKTDNSGHLEIILDKNGNITSEKSIGHNQNTIGDFNVNKNKAYILNQLTGKGFTEEEIEKWFDKKESENASLYRTGIYKGQAVSYTLKDNITVRIRGGNEVKIDTVEKLMEYMGINSRNNLKEKGLTDEVIDKYFNLGFDSSDGKATYGLKFGYSSYKVHEDLEGGIRISFGLNDDSGYVSVILDKDGNVVSEKTWHYYNRSKD